MTAITNLGSASSKGTDISWPLFRIVGTQRGAGGEEALRQLIARAGIESPEDSDSNSDAF